MERKIINISDIEIAVIEYITRMQGLINQAAYIGHSVSQTRLKELKKEIEQRHNLEERSVDKGVGIPTDSLLFPRLDTYGIKKGTVNIGGVVIA